MNRTIQGLVFILLVSLAVASCRKDPAPEPSAVIASFQYDVSETDWAEVTFTNYSVNATSHAWDFGDGNIGTGRDTSHVYSLHGNYRFPFLNDYSIMMQVNYMQQGQYNRLDIGSIFQLNQFIVGITAATNPARNDLNSHLLTSINTFIGLEYTQYRFGLSYDINTSKIGNTLGVYEFSLTYLSRCRRCNTDRSRKR